MFVYAMINQGNSEVSKVGFSNNPDRRKDELNEDGYGRKFGCYGWTVYKVLKIGETAQKVEAEIHKILKSKGLHITMGGNGKRQNEQELFNITSKCIDLLFKPYEGGKSKSLPKYIEVRTSLTFQAQEASKKQVDWEAEYKVRKAKELKEAQQRDIEDEEFWIERKNRDKRKNITASFWQLVFVGAVIYLNGKFVFGAW